MKMIKSYLAISLLACSLSPHSLIAAGMQIPTDISQKAKPATIKVLVAKQKDKVFLEAKGRYLVYNPDNEMLLSSGVMTRKHMVTPDSTGLKWGEVFPGIFQVRFVPGDSQSTLLVDGIEYRGCVEIYDIRGKLHVVNEVDVERYLKSVLTTQAVSEMNAEVMDALAIVARTNAYYLVSRKLEAPWHVDAQDVGYQGYALTLQNLHVDRAIDSTRHMVLTYHNAPFATAWTKDSAGKTASFATIFRKDVDAPSGVANPFAARDRDKHHWTCSLNKQELAGLIGAEKISAIDLYEDKESQKVYGLRIKEGEQVHQLDFFKLQRAIGAHRLKSNDFTVQVNGDQVLFSGYGEGHGVGLCLYSATAMAEHGEKAQKILSTFFPETKLENIRSFKMIADNAY